MQIINKYSLAQIIGGQYEVRDALSIIEALAIAAIHLQHQLSCVFNPDGSSQPCESIEAANAINIERARHVENGELWKKPDVIPSSDKGAIIAVFSDGSIHSGRLYVKSSLSGLCYFMSVGDNIDRPWSDVSLWMYMPEDRLMAAKESQVMKKIKDFFDRSKAFREDVAPAMNFFQPDWPLCQQDEDCKQCPENGKKSYLERVLDFNGRDISVTTILEVQALYIEMKNASALSEMDIQVANAVESIFLSLKDVLDKNCSSKGFICIGASIN